MTNTPKALEQQRARRRALVAAGLTIYGTPRKNYQWPELAGLSGRARMHERIRICTLRARRAKKNAPPVVIQIVRRQTIIEELDDLARSIGNIYEFLPGGIKQRCIAFVKKLGVIRKRLIQT